MSTSHRDTESVVYWVYRNNVPQTRTSDYVKARDAYSKLCNDYPGSRIRMRRITVAESTVVEREPILTDKEIMNAAL